MMPSSGKRFFSAASRAAPALGIERFAAVGVFSFGSTTGNSASTGMRSFTHCSATAQQPVDRHALDARHGSHFSVRAFPSITKTG